MLVKDVDVIYVFAAFDAIIRLPMQPLGSRSGTPPLSPPPLP